MTIKEKLKFLSDRIDDKREFTLSGFTMVYSINETGLYKRYAGEPTKWQTGLTVNEVLLSTPELL